MPCKAFPYLLPVLLAGKLSKTSKPDTESCPSPRKANCQGRRGGRPSLLFLWFRAPGRLIPALSFPQLHPPELMLTGCSFSVTQHLL